MLYDFHLHTNFSGDCQIPPEIMIEQGIQKGLAGICITDHQDFDFPYEKVTFDLDIPDYYAKYLELKDFYKESLQLFFGVELGLQPHLAEKHSAYVNTHPFDFVIGSIHLVNRVDPWYPDYFIGRDDHSAFEEYFEDLVKNIRGYHDFDVLGHLDYIIRYSPNKDKNYNYLDYQDYIDEALQILVAKGIGLEVNTGSIKSGLDCPNPCVGVLKRYQEFGGEILTLGSDAHKPEYVGYHFKEMQELLRSCGFRYFSTFHERKAKMHPL